MKGGNAKDLMTGQWTFLSRPASWKEIQLKYQVQLEISLMFLMFLYSISENKL
jgi:hypothetical protein